MCKLQNSLFYGALNITLADCTLFQNFYFRYEIFEASQRFVTEISAKKKSVFEIIDYAAHWARLPAPLKKNRSKARPPLLNFLDPPLATEC